MLRRALVILLAALLGGGGACGTAPGDGAMTADAAAGDVDASGSDVDLGAVEDARAPGDLATPPDLAVAATYPAGPYGNRVGDVIAPLAWQGYVNDAADAVSTTKTFGAYSMDALRRSGRRYAMVHVSEFT